MTQKEFLKEYEALCRKYKMSLYDINEQFQNNWNELKKHLEEDLKGGRSEENIWLMGCYDQVKEVLNKMQELENRKV